MNSITEIDLFAGTSELPSRNTAFVCPECDTVLKPLTSSLFFVVLLILVLSDEDLARADNHGSHNILCQLYILTIKADTKMQCCKKATCNQRTSVLNLYSSVTQHIDFSFKA